MPLFSLILNRQRSQASSVNVSRYNSSSQSIFLLVISQEIEFCFFFLLDNVVACDAWWPVTG